MNSRNANQPGARAMSPDIGLSERGKCQFSDIGCIFLKAVSEEITFIACCRAGASIGTHGTLPKVPWGFV